MQFQSQEISGESLLVKRIMPRLVSTESPVFLDVGANQGNYTATLHQAFPTARIHAFEPAASTFAALQARFEQYPGIHCSNLALGENIGTLALSDYAARPGSSHASVYRDVLTTFHRAADVITRKVDVSTVDAILSSRGLQDIDLLKIDTEGYESAVLAGAKQSLAENRILCIHFEFNEMNVISWRFLKDIYDLLQNFLFF